MNATQAKSETTEVDASGGATAVGPRRIGAITAAAGLVLIAGIITVMAISGTDSDGQAEPSVQSQTNSLLSQGVMHYRSGELDSAAGHFRAALALQSNNVRAHYDLGVVAGAQGKATLALQQYSSALKINPLFAPARFNRAALEAKRSNMAAATRDYRVVIQVQPRNASALWNLGLLLSENGRKSDGQALMKQALVITPSLRSRLPAGVSLG